MIHIKKMTFFLLTYLFNISLYSLHDLIKEDIFPSIQHIHVIGERCSGTNFIGQLILANIAKVSVSDPMCGEPIGWKHGYVLDDVINKNKKCLFIHVYRNPYDWIRSFHIQPWHAENSLLKLPFSEFIKKEWRASHPNPETEIVHERNIENGNFFRNIIELRTIKLKHFEDLKNRTPYFYSIPYEAVNDNPVKFLKRLAQLFPLNLKKAYTPITLYKGDKRRPKRYKKKQYSSFNQKDLEFINQELDWNFENSLGYEINKEDACSRKIS